MRKLLFTVLMLLPFIVIGQTTEKIKYYESGAIQVKANYVDGKRQGKMITYFESGAIQGKIDFVEGKEQGEAIIYYESGAIKAKYNYVDGVLINNK